MTSLQLRKLTYLTSEGIAEAAHRAPYVVILDKSAAYETILDILGGIDRLKGRFWTKRSKKGGGQGTSV